MHRRSLPQSGPTETHWSCGLQLGKSRKTRPGRIGSFGHRGVSNFNLNQLVGMGSKQASINQLVFLRDSKFVSSILSRILKRAIFGRASHELLGQACTLWQMVGKNANSSCGCNLTRLFVRRKPWVCFQGFHNQSGRFSIFQTWWCGQKKHQNLRPIWRPRNFMMAESPLTPVASDSVPLDPSRTMAKGVVCWDASPRYGWKWLKTAKASSFFKTEIAVRIYERGCPIFRPLMWLAP